MFERSGIPPLQAQPSQSTLCSFSVCWREMDPCRCLISGWDEAQPSIRVHPYTLQILTVAEIAHCPGYPKTMCWCTKFLPSGDDGLGGAQLCHQPLPTTVALDTPTRERCDHPQHRPPAWQKGISSLPWFPLLWCCTSSPPFVWRTPLCRESQWKRILNQWKAKNKGWPVSPAGRVWPALGSRKIKVWLMWRRTRRVGINSFLSLHGLWYFYNILWIPGIFFLIYHPNKHPWEMLRGSCPEGKRFKKRLFPGLQNLTGKCVIVCSDCSLSLGKTQQCPKHGVYSKHYFCFQWQWVDLQIPLQKDWIYGNNGFCKKGGKESLWALFVTNPACHLCRCWWPVQVAPHYGGPDLLQLSGGQRHGVPLVQKGEFCTEGFSLQKDRIQRWNHVYIVVTPSLGEVPKEELFSSWHYKYNCVYSSIHSP